MEIKDDFKFVFNGASKAKGIDGGEGFTETLFGLRVDVGGVQEALAGRLRVAVLAVTLRVDPFLAFQFECRAEEILEETPLVCVEAVDGLHQIRVIETVVPEELSDMGPLLLLHVGVVIGMVGTPPGERDGRLLVGEIPQDVMVDEFPTIVAIESQDRKRESGFDVLELAEHAFGSPVPSGPILGPATVDVGECQTPDEVASHGISAMGNGIRLQIPRPGNVPVRCPNGNLIPE